MRIRGTGADFASKEMPLGDRIEASLVYYGATTGDRPAKIRMGYPSLMACRDILEYVPKPGVIGVGSLPSVRFSVTSIQGVPVEVDNTLRFCVYEFHDGKGWREP